MNEFQEFPKIARLNRECVVTEKIDGTNAQIHIEHVSTNDVTVPPFLAIVGEYGIAAASRSQYVYPTADNYGFAKWVVAHAEELVTGLGAGRHYGEWWGQGIQRKYGLTEKRFSLFNTHRWAPDHQRPACCHVVPVLYQGLFATAMIGMEVEKLRVNGSVAAPGFMKPEGIVVYHTAAKQLFKWTLEKDDQPKTVSK